MPVAVVPRAAEVRSVPVQAVHPWIVTAGEPGQKTAIQSEGKKYVRGEKKAMEI